jgi:putative exosortase-associated protein (TIGR04073 family)
LTTAALCGIILSNREKGGEHMQRSLLVLLLVVAMVFAFSSVTLAAHDGNSPKLARGMKNVGLGWTEIPKNIVDTSKQSNVIAGVTVGVIKGVCQAVARTISGAVDVVTFPVGTSDRPAIKPSMIPESPAATATDTK